MKKKFFEDANLENTEYDYSKPCEFVIKDGILKEIKNLTCKRELIIPEGVVSIDFFIIDMVDTENLEKIVFPSTLKDIGVGNFVNLPVIKEIVLNNNFVLENGCLYSSDYKILYFCLKDVSGELKVKEGCKRIYDWAFYECKKLTKIILPESVDDIFDYAFMNCFNLQEVVFPKEVNVFAYSILFNDDNITRIICPDNVKILNSYFFPLSDKLLEIVLPEQLEKILYDKKELDKTGFLSYNTRVVLKKHNKEIESLFKKYKVNYTVL